MDKVLNHLQDGEPVALAQQLIRIPSYLWKESEVARFIADHEITGVVILHTENARGREAMESILSECQSVLYSRLHKLGFHPLLKLIAEES